MQVIRQVKSVPDGVSKENVTLQEQIQFAEARSMAGFDCFRVICVVTYKPSLHLNSYCAELVQVRKMKIRRRLLDISQGKCLTICVSRVRNRTKLFLSWHRSKCHDMNEDAHFLFCTINFL